MSRKDKGMSMLEIIMTAGILFTVLSFVIPYFYTNSRSFSTVQVRQTLQEDGKRAIEEISKQAIQCMPVKVLQSGKKVQKTTGIVEINGDYDYDYDVGAILNSSNPTSITSITFRRTESVAGTDTDYNLKYELNEHKLYFIKYKKDDDEPDLTDKNVIALNVNSIQIKPAVATDKFKETSGIIVTANLEMGQVKTTIESQINFRNAK